MRAVTACLDGGKLIVPLESFHLTQTRRFYGRKSTRAAVLGSSKNGVCKMIHLPERWSLLADLGSY